MPIIPHSVACIFRALAKSSAQPNRYANICINYQSSYEDSRSVALIFVIIGGINWGLVDSNFDLVAALLGSGLS
jgi:hypothetical protein